MGDWIDEIEKRLRGLVRRAKPRTIDDTGESQTAGISVLNSEHRTDVEILQPYGFSSHAPVGSVMLVLAVGGDQGDLVGLPVSAPGTRMGGLLPGEAVMYGGAGQRVLCRADGGVEVLAATKVYVNAKVAEIAAVEAVSVAAPKVRVAGEVWLMGDVHIAGNLTVGGTTTQAPPPAGDPAPPSR